MVMPEQQRLVNNDDSPSRSVPEENDSFSTSSWPVLAPRVLYTALFLWTSASSGRFLSTFLQHELGMTSSEIGFCLAAQSVVSTFVGFGAGTYADARERARPGRGRVAVLRGGVAWGTLVFVLHAALPWAPRMLSGPTTTTTAAGGVVDDDDDYQLAYHVLLQILVAVGVGVVIVVLDGITLDYLERQPGRSPTEFGQERWWGALSWAATHIGIGVALDLAGGSFAILYPLTVFGMVVSLLALHQFAMQQEETIKRRGQQEQEQQPLTPQMEKEDHGGEDGNQTARPNPSLGTTSTFSSFDCLWLFFGNLYGLTFMICMFILSVGQILVESLVFLFFEDLGGSYVVMGITVLITVSIEIPLFFYAPVLLEQYSPGILLMVASFCYMVRVVGYSWIPHGHLVYAFVLEPLHGITYACSKTAAVELVSQTMPPGYEATGQGILRMVRGMGSVVGLVYGGWAMDHWGSRLMYRVSAGGVLLATTLFGVVHWVRRPRAAEFPPCSEYSPVGP